MHALFVVSSSFRGLALLGKSSIHDSKNLQVQSLGSVFIGHGVPAKIAESSAGSSQRLVRHEIAVVLRIGKHHLGSFIRQEEIVFGP
jgi:hypothetical protein